MEDCADLPSRITTLLDRGDGYVVLRGATGTLAEIGLLLEMMNKGLMAVKPVVFLGDFWAPLLGLLAGQPLLGKPDPFQPVEGVKMLGVIALADSPESAARFLAVNLLGQDLARGP